MYKLEHSIVRPNGIVETHVYMIPNEKLKDYIKEFKEIVMQSNEYRKMSYEIDKDVLISLSFAYNVNSIRKLYVFTKEQEKLKMSTTYGKIERR